MTFEIEVNGRTRTVSVERLPPGQPPAGPSPSAAPRFRVTIDGTVHLVDAVRVDAGALSIITAGKEGAGEAGAGEHGAGASHHVSVTETAPGDLTLSFAEGVVRAVVNGRRVRRAGEGSGPTGAQRIVAPMPGKVLRVLVQPGADVAVRQPLVVVEAMKMENELSSPKAGTVKEVAVTEGQSVEAGRLLVVVE